MKYLDDPKDSQYKITSGSNKYNSTITLQRQALIIKKRSTTMFQNPMDAMLYNDISASKYEVINIILQANLFQGVQSNQS